MPRKRTKPLTKKEKAELRQQAEDSGGAILVAVKPAKILLLLDEVENPKQEPPDAVSCENCEIDIWAYCPHCGDAL